MAESFLAADDCPVRSIEIERNEDDEPHRRDHVGKLWAGAEWINVAEARALRDWLNKVIP
jgi:hypothetical protein